MPDRPLDTTSTDADHDHDGDSSDVVKGEIGHAHLVEPTKAEALSADLDVLPDVDAGVDAIPRAAETPRT